MQETTAKKGVHWSGIDYVKGILIILVYLGHVILGDIRDTYPKYLIYSFHMPLFIGISGFLLNIEKMDLRIISLAKKYWKRMIFPWIIAVAAYYIVRVVAGLKRFSVMSFLEEYYVPYYHLWYVLALLSYLIFVCCMWAIFKKTRLKWVWILSIAAVISVISKWELLNGHLGLELLNTIYETADYAFRPFYLLFFILGIFLRYIYEHKGQISSKKAMEGIRAMAGISIIIVSVLFFFDYSNMEYIMFYVMNCFLLIVVLYDCTNQRMPESSIIEFFGKYSLPIYLYHVFCKEVGMIVCEAGSTSYYLVCAITFIIECVLIYFLSKVNFINSVFFGSTSSSLKAKSSK